MTVLRKISAHYLNCTLKDTARFIKLYATMLNRRDALQRLAIITGGMAILPEWAGAVERWSTGTWQPVAAPGPDIAALLAEIAETIIPTTDTPGAKAAKVEEFIMLIMQDCTDPADRDRFYQGLDAFEASCRKDLGKGFIALDKAERIKALKQAEADAVKAKDKGSDKRPFFSEMKQLTMTGYFTSEIGATQALEYVHIPGSYQGCVPLTPGKRAWAS